MQLEHGNQCECKECISLEAKKLIEIKKELKTTNLWLKKLSRELLDE